jgi:hypothetical protein
MIKTVQNIYSEYSGVDNHEKIRNFIIDAYNNYGIDYVFLAGDADGIPVRSMCLIITVGDDDVKVESWVPSDMYYACLDGPYNYDGDYKWGEYTDGENGGHPDIFPEIYIGRACVDNDADVSRFVVKTLQYINSDSNDLYLKKVLLAGEYCGFGGEGDWGGNTLNELINQCSKHGYTTTGIPTKKFRIDTLYDENWPMGDLFGWPAEELFRRINNNVHIINHVGHGDAWSVMKISIMSPFYNIYNLKNDKPFFVYSVACGAGEFDDYECIGEYLTFKTDGVNKYSGAFAGLFNTKYGIAWSDSTDGPSPRLLREFWDAVFGENIKIISKANQDSKEDNIWLINVSNDVDYMRYVFYSLNLFGDPTISFIQPKTKDVSKDRLMDHNPILARLLKFFLNIFT